MQTLVTRHNSPFPQQTCHNYSPLLRCHLSIHAATQISNMTELNKYINMVDNFVPAYKYKNGRARPASGKEVLSRISMPFNVKALDSKEAFKMVARYMQNSAKVRASYALICRFQHPPGTAFVLSPVLALSDLPAHIATCCWSPWLCMAP